jgi:GNAT superfamily N-acetyltransferase
VVTDHVATWRQHLGASTALWAGSGRHEVTEQRWLTLSGCPSTDFNVILCYGDQRGDWGPLLTESLADVKLANVPSVIMVTGVALGSVQVLIDAKWVCIGEVPLMHLAAAEVPPDPRDEAVRVLGADDLGNVRAIVSEAFGLPPDITELGIPDATTEPGPFALWGVEIDGRLVSVAASVRVGSSAAFWSVATPSSEHRRGYGQRLFASVHPRLREEGVEDFLLYASGPGQALYRRLGYSVVENWQLWSYPRWVLGRA